jgi:hypothetical protein
MAYAKNCAYGLMAMLLSNSILYEYASQNIPTSSARNVSIRIW